MVSFGRTLSLGFSRESKRLTVLVADSSPRSSQPRFVDGLSSHPCTSAFNGSDENAGKVPPAPTGVVALRPASKSPPAVVHIWAGKERWIQVASPACEAAPAPSPLSPIEAPSPQ